MEFRVLGSLAVSGEGVPVDVRGPICRKLLALLLVEPGRSASVPWLIDGIWKSNPPQTASRQVRNAAGRLRKVLGPERIVSEGDGYRLDTMGTTIDSLQFETAIRDSRRVAAAGDARQAAARLRTGLELWRGPAFADVSGRVVEAKAARLEEARLSAVEDCISWELDGGEPRHVIDELRQLLSEHPYRQNLAGLLMTALQRAGQTSQALQVYEHTRSRLAADLGLDPDRALRDRYAEITGGGVRANAPAQLPMRPTTFVGRAEQLSVLNNLIAEGERARVCVVSGAPGTGKTALAVGWAHQVRERFPDGQLFINLRGIDRDAPVTALDALGRFIRALQAPETPVPTVVGEAAAWYRSLLDGKRVLVVLDNARDAEQVRPLLPTDGDCFTVVTSRNRLGGLTVLDSATSMELAPLPRAEAVDLLGAVIGSRRLCADRAVAEQLAALCGDLPLALRIGAAQLTNDPHRSIVDFVSELGRAERLDVLTMDDDPDVTVSSALEMSFLALDRSAQCQLLRLGVIPGADIPRQLAQAVADTSESEADRLLARLESAHLIERHSTTRYRFHDLTREFAQQRSHAPASGIDVADVRERVINWYHDRRFEYLGDYYDNIVAAARTWRNQGQSWKLLVTLNILAANGHDATIVDEYVDDELDRARRSNDTEALQPCTTARPKPSLGWVTFRATSNTPKWRWKPDPIQPATSNPIWPWDSWPAAEPMRRNDHPVGPSDWPNPPASSTWY